MYKLRMKARKSGFFNSILQLTTGSIIAQFISILVSPLTTRLYNPEELGVYTLIISFVTIIGPIINGKYDTAIVYCDEEEVDGLVKLSFLFSTFMILLTTIIYSIFLKYNKEILYNLNGFSYIIIFIIFFNGIINILNSINNRTKEYKLLSSVYILRTAIQNGSLIIFGLMQFGSIGLLFSQFIGTIAGIKKQSKNIKFRKVLYKNISYYDIKKLANKYRNLPLFTMPAFFISNFSYSVLNFFISALFGLNVFGFYSMTYRILGLPLSLISVNVSKVFFQRASDELKTKGNYTRILKQLTLFLVVLSIPMVLVLTIFGPYLFGLVFGDGWEVSGVYARILAPMFGIRFIVGALTPAFTISNKQKSEFVFQILFMFSSLITYIFGEIFNLDIYHFLSIFSIINIIVYIIFYLKIYKLSKGELHE